MAEQKLIVYAVVHSKHYTGMRIEAYTNVHYIYKNKKLALARAQEIADKIMQDKDDYQKVVYTKKKGNVDIAEGFKITDGDYDWANDGVYVKELTMDLSQDVVLTVTDQDW